MARGDITVRLIGDAKDLERTLAAASGNLAKSGKNLVNAGGGIGKRLSHSMFDPLKVAAGVGLERAGEAVLSFGKESVQAFQASQQASTQLQDAYSRFPKLQNVTRDSLDKLAGSIADHTKFSRADVIATESQLAQYNLTGKQLESLTPLVADFAARTGQSIPDAAGAVGKALLGNTRALKSIGINYKSTHDAAKDYVNIQNLLAEKVGGFANKQGKTAAGQLAIMGHRFEELKVKIGAALVPILSVLLKALEPLFPVFEKIVDVVSTALQPVMGALGKAFGQVIAALIPLLDPIAKLLVAFIPLIPAVAQLAAMLISALLPVLIPVITFVTKLVAALLANKVILKIVAVALLALVGPLGFVGTIVAVVAVLVIKHWGAIKRFLLAAWNEIKRVAGVVFGFLKSVFLNFTPEGLIIKHWDSIKHALGAAWNAIKKSATTIFNFLKNLFLNFTPLGIIIKHWSDILAFFKKLPGRIASVAKGMWHGISDAFRAAINFIIRAWNSLHFKIPGFSLGPVKFGGFTLGLPQIPTLDTGAIVTSPTLALLAKNRRPEAVIPLDRIGGIGGTHHTFHINIVVPIGVDKAAIGREMVEAIKAYERSSGKAWRAA